MKKVSTSTLLWSNKLLHVGLLFLVLCATTIDVSAFSADATDDAVVQIRSQLRLKRSIIERSFPDEKEEAVEDSGESVAKIAGGWERAVQVSKRHGYEVVAEVRGARDTYVLREAEQRDDDEVGIDKRGLDEGSASSTEQRHRRLVSDKEVRWAERQHVKQRVKRDFLPDEGKSMNFNDELWSKQWYLVTRLVFSCKTRGRLPVTMLQRRERFRNFSSGLSKHDTRTKEDLPKLDLHVVGAWKMNVTGAGVVVTILDDGVQRYHPDIAANYDPKASIDLNGNDSDPTPALNDYNRHGTRCAGEVSMIANNELCGVGVAFNSKIGGIRMLDGKITDRLEAEALQYNIDHVDIFSASWGPNDDGKTVEGPGKLAEEALFNGIHKGRDGKGVIYVWASGNGGTYNDNCDCDGYADSIFTLSISSASQEGTQPWYGERCSSTMATTYSSGAYTDQKITTIDVMMENEKEPQCTTEHTGTSASAPLAAGIVALGLEANPKLNWRDVQHLTAWTSEPAPLKSEGWRKNAAGFYISTQFGFGLMNAEAFVKYAKTWKSVPEQKICTTTFPEFHKKVLRAEEAGVVKFSTDGCKGQDNEINYLEHIQLVADIDYTRRGNLVIYLESPSGSKTKMLSPRRRDNSRAGFTGWPFMSVHTWGEDPKGWWTLTVADKDSQSGSDFGSIKNITLIAYGTKEMPDYYKNGPRVYDMNYNRVQDRSAEERRAFAAELGQDAHKRAAFSPNSKREADEHINIINRALNQMDDILEKEEDERLRERRSVHYEKTISQ